MVGRLVGVERRAGRVESFPGVGLRSRMSANASSSRDFDVRHRQIPNELRPGEHRGRPVEAVLVPA